MLDKLFGRQRRKSSPPATGRRLLLERLEDRTLLDAGMGSALPLVPPGIPSAVGSPSGTAPPPTQPGVVAVNSSASSVSTASTASSTSLRSPSLLYSVAEGQTLTATGLSSILALTNFAIRDTLTVTPVDGSTAEGAVLTVEADGSFVYQSVANFVGVDSFDVTISNGLTSAVVKVQVGVFPPGEPAPVSAGPVSTLDRWGNNIDGFMNWLVADPIARASVDASGNYVGVGQPTGAEAFVPFWGNFRGGFDDFQNERWLLGSCKIALAVGDLVGIGELYSLAGKGGGGVIAKIPFGGSGAAVAGGRRTGDRVGGGTIVLTQEGAILAIPAEFWYPATSLAASQWLLTCPMAR